MQTSAFPNINNINADQMSYFHERLKVFLEAGQVNYWEWYPKTDELIDFGFLGPLGKVHPYKDSTLESFFTRVHPEDVDHVRKKLKKAISGNKTYRHEFRLYDLKGNIQWIHARGLVIYDEQGKAERMIGIGALITERKNEMEATLKIAHASRISSMHQITSMLLHDLTQPLQIIKSYVEGCIIRLHDFDSNADQIQETLKKISAQVSHLGEITCNIKNFVCKGELNYEKIGVAELVHSAITLFNYQNSSISFLIDCKFDQEVNYIQVDVTQIKQVLLNLILNSFEAMRDAGSDIRIEIQTKKLSSKLMKIKITDTGPGISQEIQKKLFTSYFTTKKEGMGMGLGICRAIIEAHGGKLIIGQDNKIGCCIKLILPISP